MNLAEEGGDWKPTSNNYEADCKLQRARESELTAASWEKESSTVKLLA